MIGKGIYEFEFEGNKVGFKFGMYAAGITEREAKCTIVQLFENITTGNEPSLNLLYYFYGGAVAYNLNHKISQDINLDHVSDYISAIGYTEAMRIFSDSVKHYEPKNEKAPQEPGPKNGE